MRSALLRNSLRLGVAGFLTTALSLRFERIAYAWYPMLAGWKGVLVSLLLSPSHLALNGDDVFNRPLDEAVGCVMPMLADRLFWPRWGVGRLMRLDLGLRSIEQAEQRWRDLGEAPR